MTCAAATRSLFFRDDDRAFGLAGVAQLHRDAIRRIDFEEVVNAFAEDTAFQTLAQRVGREDVGRFFEKVAGVLLAFDAHTEIAESIDPAPHRRARNADLARNACAADNNCRVFGEEVQQRCDAAVGRSGERLLGGALGHEKREV